jgi:hypothetical protein
MTIDRRRVLAALLGVAAAPVLVACASDDGAEEWGESADSGEDCDAGDLAGKNPVPPAGVKVNPPCTGCGTRTGGGSGSRTGGSRTGGSRTGGRR